MSSQHFSLRWNNYSNHIANAFDSLRSQEDLVDVTLCCDGRKIRAHKVLLSACSIFFRDVFKENPCQHPVIVFKSVKYDDLLALIEFMYQGEVSVQQDALPSFLTTAEMLAVQGLTTGNENTTKESSQPTTTFSPASATSSSFVQSPHIPTHITTTPLNAPKVFPNIPSMGDIRFELKSTSQASTGIGISTSSNADMIILPAQSTTVQKIRTMPSSLTKDNAQEAPMKKRRISNDSIVEQTNFLGSSEDMEQHDEEAVISLHEEGEIQESPPRYLKMETPEYIDDARQRHSDQHSSQEDTDEHTDEHQLDSGETDGRRRRSATVDDEQEVYKIIDEGESDLEMMYHQESNSAIEMGQIYASQSSVDIKSKIQLTNTQDVPTSKWSQCQFCKLVITTVNLWRHIRTQHTSQPPRQCDRCQKKFKNKYSLREHVRIAHEQKISGKIELTIEDDN